MKPITADIDLVAAGPHGGHHGQEDTTMAKSQTPLHNAYVTPPPPANPAARCLLLGMRGVATARAGPPVLQHCVPPSRMASAPPEHHTHNGATRT